MTPLALAAGLFSAGAGHGDYVLAKALFPYTMLSTAFTDTITIASLIIAIAQFPVYGVVLASGAQSSSFRTVVFALLIIHLIAVLLAFLFSGDSFAGLVVRRLSL